MFIILCSLRPGLYEATRRQTVVGSGDAMLPGPRMGRVSMHAMGLLGPTKRAIRVKNACVCTCMHIHVRRFLYRQA